MRRSVLVMFVAMLGLVTACPGSRGGGDDDDDTAPGSDGGAETGDREALGQYLD
jgi:hypothetical protein